MAAREGLQPSVARPERGCRLLAMAFVDRPPHDSPQDTRRHALTLGALPLVHRIHLCLGEWKPALAARVESEARRTCFGHDR
jgi:hypothetical protein